MTVKLKPHKRSAREHAALAVMHRRKAEAAGDPLIAGWHAELAHRSEIRARLHSAMDILRG